MSNTTSNFSWSEFEASVYLNVPVARAFSAWTRADTLTSWFLSDASFTSADGTTRAPNEPCLVGDSYMWQWHDGFSDSGEILEKIEARLLRVSFGEPEIHVSVNFEVISEKETRILLRQENMPDTPEAHVSWHLSCRLGWNFYLVNLKAFLENGIDLREKNSERAKEQIANK